MRAPASGCPRTSAHSSSSSGSALSSSSAGRASLPTSCTSAPSWMAGGGVGVGPEMQGDVARVERDGGRVLGGLGIEGRERAHEGHARRQRRAVDGAGRAAATPWGAEESAHVCSTTGGAGRERVARIAPSVYDALRSTPAKRLTAGASTGRQLSYNERLGLLPAVGPAMGPTVGPTVGPSVCVHMTLLPVPGTASEVARETILGPSTRRLYRMGTQSASSLEPVPNNSSRKRYVPRAPMRYAPQIAGKRARARARRSSPHGPGESPAPAQALDPQDPHVSRASLRNQRKRRAAGVGPSGVHTPPRGRPRLQPEGAITLGTGVIARPRPGLAGAKTQKGRPHGRPFSRSCRARVSGTRAGLGPTLPRRVLPRRSRSRRPGRRSAPRTRSPP